MPPIDAGANAAPATASTATSTSAVTDLGIGVGPDTSSRLPESSARIGTECEDTLDLRLPDELIALFAQDADADTDAHGDLRDQSSLDRSSLDRSSLHRFSLGPSSDDLLDQIADWGPALSPAGVFQLVPVHVERDLPLISRWMNDPAVAEFWELAGSQTVTEDHLRAQLTGDGRSLPCLGVLEGTPMSYWEIYRADLDPLARHYPARPHDTGIHLLIGGVADRGRGLGSTLLRTVADLALDKRPACARVIAEPDLRNAPSVAAFLRAGFRFSAEVDLPAKRAALMIRDRSLRDLL